MCPELGPLKKYTSVVMKPNPAVWKHLSLKGLPGNWPAVWFFIFFFSLYIHATWRQAVCGGHVNCKSWFWMCVCVCVRVCVCVCVCDSSLEKKKEGSLFWTLQLPWWAACHVVMATAPPSYPHPHPQKKKKKKEKKKKKKKRRWRCTGCKSPTSPTRGVIPPVGRGHMEAVWAEEGVKAGTCCC